LLIPYSFVETPIDYDVIVGSISLLLVVYISLF